MVETTEVAFHYRYTLLVARFLGQVKRLLIIRFRFVDVAELLLRVAAAIIGGGIVRLQLNGPVKIRKGSFGLAEFSLRIAAIIVGGGIVRLQLNGPVIIRKSGLVLAEVPLRIAMFILYSQGAAKRARSARPCWTTAFSLGNLYPVGYNLHHDIHGHRERDLPPLAASPAGPPGSGADCSSS